MMKNAAYPICVGIATILLLGHVPRKYDKLAVGIVRPLLTPQKPNVGRASADHRRILNGILWILRTGARWRDLPERYGPWRTVASRFCRWRKAGTWDQVFVRVKYLADA